MISTHTTQRHTRNQNEIQNQTNAGAQARSRRPTRATSSATLPKLDDTHAHTECERADHRRPPATPPTRHLNEQTHHHRRGASEPTDTRPHCDARDARSLARLGRDLVHREPQREPPLVARRRRAQKRVEGFPVAERLGVRVARGLARDAAVLRVVRKLRFQFAASSRSTTLPLTERWPAASRLLLICTQLLS